MNSPFANIFLAIQARIQDQVSTINYIDQDLGQFNNDARPSVSFPAVLIDFEHFHFQALSDNVQTAFGTVVLYLGFAPTSSSSSSTPTDYIEQAIGFYDIEWNMHIALQGWTPGDGFGCLTRSSAVTLKRPNNIRVREIHYQLAFQDYSTKPTQTQITAAINIEPQINH